MSKPTFIALTSAGSQTKVRANPACITTFREVVGPENSRIPAAVSVVNLLDETIYVLETPEQIDAMLGVTAEPLRDAAPDMLDALKMAREWTDDWIGGKPLHDVIDAALSRATGKE